MPALRLKRKGYILCYMPEHPHASKWGYVAKSRLVVEFALQRILPSGLVFHHKNNDVRPTRVVQDRQCHCVHNTQSVHQV